MKKIFIFLTALFTYSISYSIEISQIGVESGMTGFEIENNFTYHSLEKNLNKNTEELYEKYEIIKNNWC